MQYLQHLIPFRAEVDILVQYTTIVFQFWPIFEHFLDVRCRPQWANYAPGTGMVSNGRKKIYWHNKNELVLETFVNPIFRNFD